MSTAEAAAAGVTVVIPHYGDPALASHVVDALFAQASARPIQVVVSDDASPLPFGQRDGVEVVRGDLNRGFGAAVNRGARVARQPWLLILNSDVDVEPDFIDRFLGEAERHEPGFFGPSIAWGHTTLPSTRRFPRPWHPFGEQVVALDRWRQTPMLQRLRGFDLSSRPDRVTRVDWVSGAAMLLRTDDFRRIGGFDESFFLYSEEVDLQWRLRRAGVPAVHIGQASLRHYGGQSTDPALVRYRCMVSDLRYARKRGRVLVQSAGYAVAIAVNAGHDVVRRLRGERIAPRQRLQGAVRELQKAYRESGPPTER